MSKKLVLVVIVVALAVLAAPASAGTLRIFTAHKLAKAIAGVTCEQASKHRAHFRCDGYYAGGCTRVTAHFVSCRAGFHGVAVDRNNRPFVCKFNAQIRNEPLALDARRVKCRLR